MGKHGKNQPCSACNGSGKISTTDDGNGKRREIPCVACGGTGTV